MDFDSIPKRKKKLKVHGRKTQTTVSLSPELRDRLDSVCAKLNCTLAAFTVAALTQAVDEFGRTHRDGGE